MNLVRMWFATVLFPTANTHTHEKGERVDRAGLKGDMHLIMKFFFITVSATYNSFL
jgi:hypothetical protein